LAKGPGMASQADLNLGEPPSVTSDVRQHARRNVDVVRPMPRRQPLAVAPGNVDLRMVQRVVFRPGIIRPLSRLFVWLWMCARFFGGNAWDRLNGRSSIQRRAVRLREVFDGAGVSFAKLAQQLSLRADMLPYVYCAELSKMLDRARPIPTAVAIKIIEDSLRRPLNEIFSTFDPQPIGSASLACVYQAKLKETGEVVAVKVRRPGIGPLLAADLRALDWLLIFAEMLTLIRPGLTTQFRRELRTILMGELDFRAEARHTEMFRLRAQADDAGITAPRVYLRYCSHEVMVTELVSGIWAWELMAAVDRNDQAFLANARRVGIEPVTVARRLMRSGHRFVLEDSFFHADPHPANLLILPNSRICFIDFGAVGRFSSETRRTWRELQYHLKNLDIEQMVASSVRLAGSLPPMDIDAATEAMKEVYADWVCAVLSPDAQWWERSASQNWLRYVSVAGDSGIPVSLELLQFFRTSLLYDSAIMRLDKDIDPIREFEVYARGAAKRARRKARRFLRERANGPSDGDYARIEQLAQSGAQFAFEFQRAVEVPSRHFRNISGKIAYGMSILARLVRWIFVLGGVGLLADYLARTFLGREIPWRAVLESLQSMGWFQIAVLCLAVVIVRRVLVRVSAPDVETPTG
jgi:ubiquinone biosynthesis protein